jgi:hypothetical protein
VLLPQVKALEKPLIIALNKIDLLDKPRLLPMMAAYHEHFPDAPVVPLSALVGDGLPALVAEIVQRLPSAPPLFPEEQLTDQTERFLVAEIIRERLFHHTGEEIPYAVAVTVEEFDESRRPELVRIRVVIYVEKASQKGIVIGKGGGSSNRWARKPGRKPNSFSRPRCSSICGSKSGKTGAGTPGPCASSATRSGGGKIRADSRPSPRNLSLTIAFLSANNSNRENPFLCFAGRPGYSVVLSAWCFCPPPRPGL